MLRAFAARHGVRRLALFGSVLRDDFGPASDVDILVEFHPGRTPGLVRVAQMEDRIRIRHLTEAASKAVAYSAGKQRADLDDDELLRLALT